MPKRRTNGPAPRTPHSAQPRRKARPQAGPTLDQQLAHLESRDLVYRAETQPELEYLFRHALVHEAAYASLVKFDRMDLHRAVGEALERLYPDRLDELAPVLARHFDRAGKPDRALEYYTRAGDAAARLYANLEAAAHYTRALETAARGPHDTGQLRHLYLRRGQALELSGRHAEALENYHSMEMLARERGDRALELAALMARATIHATFTPAHDPAQGEALLAQALTLARALGDRASEAKLLWNLMLVNLYTNRMREAMDYGQPALALARALGQREQAAFTLNDLGRVHTGLGEFERAHAALDEARALFRELGNLPMLADNLVAAAAAHYFAGDYDQVLALSAEAQRLSESSANVWGQSYSRLLAGFIHFDRGQMDKAIETMTACIRLGDEGGLVASTVGLRADLGWVYGVLGAVDRGLELARHALAIARERLPVWGPLPAAALVRLHLLRGDIAEAEALVTAIPLSAIPVPFIHYRVVIALAAIELALAQQDFAQASAEAHALLSRLPKTIRADRNEILYLQGQALIGLGRAAEARTTLRAAQAEAEALGVRRMQWPVLIALSEIEAQSGNPAGARLLRQQAKDIIAHLADHIHDPGLRASFLASPRVRAVI